jgi:hypothetical protein
VLNRCTPQPLSMLSKLGGIGSAKEIVRFKELNVKTLYQGINYTNRRGNIIPESHIAIRSIHDSSFIIV